MPKMKTSRTMAKRVKFTGTGKVKVHHAGMGHLAPRKTRKQRKHSPPLITSTKRMRER